MKRLIQGMTYYMVAEQLEVEERITNIYNFIILTSHTLTTWQKLYIMHGRMR